jgi:hypothetical protein
MLSKAEFIQEISAKRELNRISLVGRIKKEYYPSDDDLAWKLYVAFPGNLSDNERKKLLKVTVTHITQLVCYLSNKEMEKEDMCPLIKDNLKETLGIHLSCKTVCRFIVAIQKLDRWNE